MQLTIEDMNCKRERDMHCKRERDMQERAHHAREERRTGTVVTQANKHKFIVDIFE